VPPAYRRYGSQNNLWFDSFPSWLKLNPLLIGVAHSSETYLEHVRSQTTFTFQANKKVASFKCPVDVEVYNGSGDLVGKVVGNAIDENIEAREVFILFWV